jgi:hypothetical protein
MAEPVATPVTTPDVGSIVATVASLLLQVPPLTVLVKVVVLPMHKVDAPLKVPAVAVVFTVTACVLVAVPQAVVAV